MGRTHLQDAVPIRLGQEFNAYATAANRAKERISLAVQSLKSVNMGATAVGTGLNADPEYIKFVEESLREISGYDLAIAEDLVDGTQNDDANVSLL